MYLDKDVLLCIGAGNSVKVADLWTKSCRHSSIHFPAGLSETLGNTHVLSGKTITTCKRQRASEITD